MLLECKIKDWGNKLDLKPPWAHFLCWMKVRGSLVGSFTWGNQKQFILCFHIGASSPDCPGPTLSGPLICRMPAFPSLPPLHRTHQREEVWSNLFNWKQFCFLFFPLNHKFYFPPGTKVPKPQQVWACVSSSFPHRRCSGSEDPG